MPGGFKGLRHQLLRADGGDVDPALHPRPTDLLIGHRQHRSAGRHRPRRERRDEGIERVIVTDAPGASPRLEPQRRYQLLDRPQPLDSYRGRPIAWGLGDFLADTRDSITALGGDLASRADDFEKARDAAIDQRVQKLADSQGRIGLLERFDSLDRLTSTQSALRFREWFIRAVLIVIDCLPLLVKFLGGATSYDRIVDRELASGKSVHRTLREVGEDAIVTRLRADQQIRRDQVDAEVRNSLAEVLAREDQQIAERRERYRAASGRPRSRGSQTKEEDNYDQ
jgi:hypothetical protein